MIAKDKISKSLIKLLLHNPFFATLLLRLQVVEDETQKTGWTNGIKIGYNPKWIDELTFEQVMGFLVHEAQHLVLMHDIRRKHRNPVKWNHATDYVINTDLTDWNFELPPKGLVNDQFKGKSADEVYNLIPDPPKGGGGGGDGDGDGDGDGMPEWGEVRDQPGPDDKPASSSEKNFQEQERKMDLEKARQSAKRAGKLPAGMNRLVNDLLAPKLDWRVVLRRFVSSYAKNDYAWYPPNRRFVHQGLYLPSLRSEEIEKIVLAVDTSGSLSMTELAQFGGELNSILEEIETTLEVMYCDSALHGQAGAEIYMPDTFTREDLPLKLEMRGGGGTSFRPPFEWLEANGIIPTCFIYLTDMWCHDFPDPAPMYPVLWIQSGDYDNDPPFGELLSLEMG